MARHPTRAASLGLDAIQIEGGLIAPEQVAKIAATDRNPRTATDYDCPKGTNLGDEISRYFRIGQAHWQAYSRIEQPTTTQTAKFAHDLLSEAFGFTDLIGPTDRHQGTRRYRLAWEAKDGRVPIVVAAPVSTPGDGFAKAMPEFGDGSEGRAKRSPVVLLQDWLNGSDAALWGLVFAGDRVRLMRDNASLTRPAWIEADLAAMFRDEMFADFTAWWLLTHASRFGAAGTPPSSSPLEQWREAGLSQGTAARERLREGVETAIAELGQGLIEANAELRDGVATGRIALPALFEELLRTVYRLIFLAVAEDRDLLHGRAVPQGPRALYRDGYSFGFWRDRSARRAAYDGHHDAWSGMLVTLGALEQGEALLGLPPLGGLFAKGGTPILNAARIPNKRFLSAIYSLGFITVESRQTRINWRDMKTEELGSVYESLLEIRPVLMPNGDFVLEGGAKGNARKTSGSYYTPDSLVETLLDSALDPVLERAEAEGEAAILNLKVIDPACGSGHFLLGAARRMAGRLARLRNPDAGRDDEQAALRDVVSRCIHGVDRNPMAVELAKVALWIESVSPGQPLGFLDANIRCGDALLGIFSLDALADGIPDDAYKPLTGDDRGAANGLKKLNKAERDAGLLRLAAQPDKLASAFQRFHAMPENTPREVAARASEYERIRHSPDWVALRQACDAYVAAFILPKPALPSPQARPLVPTTRHIRDILSGSTMLGTGAVQGQLAAAIDGAAWGARAFHWPIEFPDVMVGRGGFDVVLGNPPFANAIENELSHSRDFEAIKFRSFGVKGAADYSARFLSLSSELPHRNGAVGLVLPRMILNSTTTDELRTRLNTSLRPSMIYCPPERNLFHGAIIDIALICLSNQSNVKISRSGIGEISWKATSEWHDNWWTIVSSVWADRKISAKIGIKLGIVFDVSGSMTTADAYEINGAISDDEHGDGQRLITTGLIDPRECHWGIKECRYLKNNYYHPRLSPSLEFSDSLNKRIISSRRPKIIVAGLSSILEAYLDDNGRDIGAVATFSIFDKLDNMQNLEKLLNYLLSNEVFMQLRDQLGGNALGGGAVTMKKGFLINLDVPSGIMKEVKNVE
ncbi:Eco57I restriction-modification methylase domain-containing protein [Sphingomonas qilianensis]|uniref:site-specific DNA-methyltransferase (adenine-specific) n=1 Tax=Sphingomonas qilianensis TaxID=1736690 RepID=A0ABU9XU46_9SPHN